MKPGQPERRDYEYERNGTANLFMMFAPLEGWRRVKVTDRRTAMDYAQALEALSDRYFPNAKKIVLVQDNLWTPPAQGDLLVPAAWNARIYPACCGTVRAPGLDGSPLLLAS
jgi:DDE superfamily endonuclease